MVARHCWAEPMTAPASHSRTRRQTVLPGVSLRVEPRTVYVVPAAVELIGQGEAFIDRPPAAVAVTRPACGPAVPPPTSESVPRLDFQPATA